MRIRTVHHKDIKAFIEDNYDQDIRRDPTNRVRRILTALQTENSIERLMGPPGWRIHQLTRDRVGTWSLSVSGN